MRCSVNLQKRDKMLLEIKEGIEKYSAEIQDLFFKLRALVCKNRQGKIQERIWAKIPSYYAGESFVRLIPFSDHINVEARFIINYSQELAGYKITPKGMLQIFVNQQIPENTLESIFKDTLSC